jgi:diguanylate cyclase (GGDEF)-like protein
MNTHNFKLYQTLSRLPLLQNSYTLKMMVIASIGIVLPPLIFTVYFLGHASLSVSDFMVLLVATLIGIIVTTYLLDWLLYPITQTSTTLRQFLNGEYKPQSVSYEETVFKDSMGQLMTEVQYITHKMDLLNHSLKDYSTFDPLTGVLNHRAAEALLRLDTVRARREKKPILVALVEVDQLQTLNEQFGYHIGDIYLTEVAKILSKSVRESDWIARWKGNQFLMVLWNFHNAKPTTVFMQIQQQLVKIPAKNLPPLSLTMGAYEYKANHAIDLGIEVTKLLVNVEESLSQIKQNHRGNIVLTQKQYSEDEDSINCNPEPDDFFLFSAPAH